MCNENTGKAGQSREGDIADVPAHVCIPADLTGRGLLGHANISVTMRYDHSNDDATRRAVQRLGTGDKV
jgi:hypothetical protein